MKSLVLALWFILVELTNSRFLVVWLTYYTGENQEAKNKCRELGLQKLEEYKDRARLCGIYTLHQHENFMLEDLIRLKES